MAAPDENIAHFKIPRLSWLVGRRLVLTDEARAGAGMKRAMFCFGGGVGEFGVSWPHNCVHVQYFGVGFP